MQKELLLYPNKSGIVHDLLEEAKKQVDLNEESSGKLRLLELTSYKIASVLTDEVLLECLNPSGSKIYRIEEIPKDELKLDATEFVIPVAHFQKEIYQTFGTPFLLKLRSVRAMQLQIRSEKHISFFYCTICRRSRFRRSKNEYRRSSMCLTKNLKR